MTVRSKGNSGAGLSELLGSLLLAQSDMPWRGILRESEGEELVGLLLTVPATC